MPHRRVNEDGVRAALVLILAWVSCSCVRAGDSPAEKSAEGGTAVRAAFGDDCEAAVRDALDSARQEIKIAIFSFSRKNIGRALVRAAERKVKVTVKYDASAMEESPGMVQEIGYIRNRGVECIPVKMSGEYGKMHHKFAVIDGKTVVTGSFNYTSTASRENYENVVVIESAEVAKAYRKEFERITDK